MTFRTSLNNSEKILLLYEVVPPNKNLPTKQVNLFVNQLSKFLSKTKVDALFIPEIVPEARRSFFPIKEKLEPRILAQGIWQKSKNIKIIISRVVVHLPTNQQKKWLLETFKNYNIKNLVLVGGEKEAKFYPGPSVSQTANLIKQTGPNYCCGGITIPTRRFKTFDEPERIIKKQKAGIKFFISQIIFEPQTTINLLRDYYQVCQKQNIKPARIFLSFAPVSLPKDIEFLESLGVLVPRQTKKILLKNQKQMAEKSIKLAKKVFEQIINFTQKNKIKVPLGINISYLTKHNFEISKKMVKSFKQ